MFYIIILIKYLLIVIFDYCLYQLQDQDKRNSLRKLRYV